MQAFRGAARDINTHIPSDGESKGVIGITRTELRNRSRQRQPGGHLAQALHHGVYSNTSEGIAQNDRERTSLSKRASDTQEQTRTDSTTKSDELDMSRFQTAEDQISFIFQEDASDQVSPSRDIAIFFCGLNVSIELARLLDAADLALMAGCGIDVLSVGASIVGRRFIDIVTPFFHVCEGVNAVR